MLIDQKSVDERLVRRGELLLSLEFLERYADELEAMNRGKEDRCMHKPPLYSKIEVFLSIVTTYFSCKPSQLFYIFSI